MYGLNLLDKSDNTFQHFLPFPDEQQTKLLNMIRITHYDVNGTLWVAGYRNLFHFDPNNNAFTLIQNKDASKDGIVIYAFFDKTDGAMVCGTNRGLILFKKDRTEYRHLTVSTKDFASASVRSILPHDNETVWLATSQGLLLYDLSKEEVIKSVVDPDRQHQLIINAIQISNGDILMSFNNDGLASYCIISDSWYPFRHDESSAVSLHDDNVHALFEDEFDNVWIGTTLGISRMNMLAKGGQLIRNTRGLNRLSNRINRIHVDRSGRIWTATDDGVYIKPKTGASSALIQLIPGQTAPHTPDWIYENEDGDMYIPATGTGILAGNSRDLQFSPLQLGSALSKARIMKIVGDNSNAQLLWLGTGSGLCLLDVNSNKESCYLPRDDIPELTNNRVIIFDQYGEDIWLYYTGNNSIGRFDKTSRQFEIYRPGPGEEHALSGTVRDIAITADGNVWLATIYGLTKFNTKNKTFNLYGSKSGLSNPELNAIVVDPQNRIWVSGGNFIAQFNPDNEQFEIHEPTEVIPRFISKSRFVSEEGHIYFGGIEGMYVFHPDSLAPDRSLPKIVLTDFSVKDSSVGFDVAVEYVRSIKLGFKDNDISFTVAGLHYMRSLANQHECLLEGFDDDWRILGPDRIAQYSNLEPGNYVFRARASNSDGLWSDNELAISLTITPPFTGTSLFIALVAFGAGLILFLLYQSWQYQQNLKRQKVFAEETAEYRMKFLSHVSHEIRTPMNAVVGLSKLLREEKLSGQQGRYIAAIEQSSRGLLSIVNALLDCSKLDSGMFTFDSAYFSLDSIIDQLRSMLNALAVEKGLKLNINSDPDVPDGIIGDGLRLAQILTNLLGNSIKYTDDGCVDLNISLDAKGENDVWIKFTIVDTGAGIDQKKLDSIFERFATASGDPMKVSSGLGLYITKELVERQGGTVQIESKLGTGTKAMVRMPFKVSAEASASAQVSKALHLIRDLHILIVDDAPFSHFVMAEILKKRVEGVSIDTAYNGVEAIAMAKEIRFDLIIMDTRMPEMDGLTATREIRKQEHGKVHVPILGATAGAMPEELEQCLASGMDDVIIKPIDPNELLRKIISTLQNDT